MFKNLNCLLSFRLVKVKAQNILKYMESGEVARAGRLCAGRTAGGAGNSWEVYRAAVRLYSAARVSLGRDPAEAGSRGDFRRL